MLNKQVKSVIYIFIRLLKYFFALIGVGCVASINMYDFRILAHMYMCKVIVVVAKGSD